MNPVQLYVQKDGEFKPVEVWACGSCRQLACSNAVGVIYTEASPVGKAEDCCKPKFCGCGEEIKDKYYSKCRTCERKECDKREEEKERKRFEKAKKITEKEYNEGDYPSYVFDPTQHYGGSGDDGWNEELGDLYQEFDDREGEEDRPPLPAYVWTSKAIKPSFDVETIVESVSSEAYEDYPDQLSETEELQKHIDDWCAEQPVYYEINYDIAVILDGPVKDSQNA